MNKEDKFFYKKTFIFFSLLLFLLVALLLFSDTGSADSNYVVKLPDFPVNMTVSHWGAQSYFDTTLSGIGGPGEGYDVYDGTFVGWCADEHHYITPGLVYQVHLYSTYDPAMPWPDDDWDMVNFIINHKDSTANKVQIQKAIWYFIDGGYSGSDPIILGMINNAINNGEGFVPQGGEKCAVLCDAGENIQHTFIEVDVPYQPEVHCEKLVWDQDSGEWVDQIRVPIGTDLIFKIIFENTGNTMLNDLYVTDNLSSQLEYRDNSNYSAYNISSDLHQVTWYFPQLDVGDSFEIVYHAESVHLCYGWNSVNVTTNEQVSDDDIVIVKVAEEGQPVIDITKKVWDDATNEWTDNICRDIGRNLQFKIIVTSTALDVVHDVVVTDILPSMLLYQYDANITPDSASDHSIAWSFISLSPGETIEIVYSARTVCEGWGDNIATVTTDEQYTDSDSVFLKIYDYPLVQLVYPRGGEVLSGTTAIRWYAIDSNDPDLELSLFCKECDSGSWILIINNLHNNVDESHGEYNWDTTVFSDGDYQIKIIAQNRFNAVASDTSNAFEIYNGYMGSKISQVTITDTTIGSTSFVKDGDSVEIKAYVTNGHSLKKEDITADLSGFGKPGSTIADSFDGNTAIWLIQGVKCKPGNGIIAVKILIYGGESNTGIITADNTPPELSITKPRNGLYFLNTRLLPLGKTIVFGPITVQVQTDDTGSGVQRAEFYLNDFLIGTVMSSPFDYYLSQKAKGKQKLTVIVYDQAGNNNIYSTDFIIYNFLGKTV